MITSAEDGTVRYSRQLSSILYTDWWTLIKRKWATEDWEEIKSLRHPSSVRDISVHPSGKILLSVGGDKTLRAWDFLEQRASWTVAHWKRKQQLRRRGKTISFAADQSRIKGMAICNDILSTGESNGTVRGHNKQGICLFEQKTEARITCLTVTTGSDDQNGNEVNQSAAGQSESSTHLDDIKKKETVKHITHTPLRQIHC